ncbi:MAG: ATP-binding protein, partial [Acidobacteriota bacterium]
LPFYSTKKTGTGLGLALSREIVEGHGGKISLQSRPGGGTIVSCWLPEQ